MANVSTLIKGTTTTAKKHAPTIAVCSGIAGVVMVAPIMKRTIANVVAQGINRLVFGKTRPRNTRASGYISYSAGETRTSYLNVAR